MYAVAPQPKALENVTPRYPEVNVSKLKHTNEYLT